METHSVSPARLERATCCSGNSRAFLLRHGDMRPPGAAVAGHACQETCVPGEGLEPPVAGRPTALQDAALPIARPWRGVTDAVRTRSLRDHSPALYLLELQPPYSAKESNLFVSRV